MIAIVLAAFLAQTEWGDFHPRRALAEEELSQAGDRLARRLRAYGIEALDELASALAVRRGEAAPVVFVEVATNDARGNAVTRASTWTRHVGEWVVQRPSNGWLELDGDRLAEAIAGIPDATLRGHLLALAKLERASVAGARGQTVRLAAVPCRWVEYETDGTCYEALLVGDVVIEAGSPAQRWANERASEAERLLAAGNIDAADNEARAALVVRPDDSAAIEVLRRVQGVQRQVIGRAIRDRELSDFKFWSYVGAGIAAASVLLIVVLILCRSKAATP